MRKNDLIGKRFGRLTVVSQNEGSFWNCKCDCGNYKNVRRDDLKSGHVKSCGCLRKENSSNSIREKNKKFRNKNYVDGTSISQLKATLKNNTSGCKGVSWDRNKQRWKAYIEFQHKRIYLGNFIDKDNAIKARKEAEEKYFKPILDKYNK